MNNNKTILRPVILVFYQAFWTLLPAARIGFQTRLKIHYSDYNSQDLVLVNQICFPVGLAQLLYQTC